MSGSSTRPFFGSTEQRDVCVRCFDDDHLKAFIRDFEAKGRCDFCHSRNIAVAPLQEMAEHLKTFIESNYSRAVDELPYESAEGGYHGSSTYSTWEVLIEEIGVPLTGPGEEQLGQALADEIGDELWCAYDWASLDPDDSLRYSWERFCETVKHKRRFFFQNVGGSKYPSPDDRSSIQILRDIKRLIQRSGLIKKLPAGQRLYHARPRKPRERFTLVGELASPPVEVALQSNRMNPPGIPMFYAADKRRLAFAEVREAHASIGRFRTTRKIRILDLADLPPIPGFFSGSSRTHRLQLSFLHSFAREIVKPVPRDQRTHVEYLPTQVFTEYLRDARFKKKRIDGIRYASATGERGTNLVLFATQEDFVGVAKEEHFFGVRSKQPWIELEAVTHM